MNLLCKVFLIKSKNNISKRIVLCSREKQTKLAGSFDLNRLIFNKNKIISYPRDKNKILIISS